MKRASINKDIEFKADKPSISLLFKSARTKEIRIAMREGQEMKEHSSPFPIVVEIFEGSILFGVNGEVHDMDRGDICALDGGVLHNLEAKEDAIIRLSIAIGDSVDRVKNVAN